MEITTTRFYGWSQQSIGHTHESLRWKVCPSCEDNRIMFEELHDIADKPMTDWQRGKAVCQNCGRVFEDDFTPGEIRIRVTIRV